MLLGASRFGGKNDVSFSVQHMPGDVHVEDSVRVVSASFFTEF